MPSRDSRSVTTLERREREQTAASVERSAFGSVVMSSYDEPRAPSTPRPGARGTRAHRGRRGCFRGARGPCAEGSVPRRDRPALRHRDAADRRDAPRDRGGGVGDEQKREDPTVTTLQERVAELLGQEAAIFLPTATMANQIALKLHGRPGDVLIAEELSHVVIYEYGGAAVHAGLMTLGLRGDRGRLTSEQVRLGAEPSTKVADQRAAMLSLENTHNGSGGRVWPLNELDEVVSTARELGLAVHLDGARLLNASTRSAGRAVGDRRPLRHGDALSLEGPRLPARCPARRLGGADGARVAREAPLRRRDAAGRDRRGSRALRTRPSRRAAGRRPRPRANAR